MKSRWRILVVDDAAATTESTAARLREDGATLERLVGVAVH